MEENFAKTVNILGQDYTIEIKESDKGFSGEHAGAFGLCNSITKKIILRDLSKGRIYEDRLDELLIQMKKTLRHEIVHGFLAESGLSYCTRTVSNWAKNEEMVDWIAIQGPKLLNAWLDAGAL